jgi:ribonuclease HI
MYRIDTRCINNQAEAFTILKALEYIQTTQTNEEDKAGTVLTDSRMTLDALYSMDIHTFLIEEYDKMCMRWKTEDGKYG